MASVITVHVPAAAAPGERAMAAALGEFRRIERACTRFDQSSPLMRANSNPGRWHRAPEALYHTLVKARRAHRQTGGLFDPRVHDRLVQLGYDRSFHLVADDPAAAGDRPPSWPAPATGNPGPGNPAKDSPDTCSMDRGTWQPRLIPGIRLIRLGGARVDLGGVGKAVALSRAAHRLRRSSRNFLIDAGGDIYASGGPGGGHRWRVGVESPSGSPGPVAVLEVSDLAVTTSSIRLRQWRRGERTVHHLIDPRTGEPGGQGLAAVTVVHPDPVVAETWAKALFLSGADAIQGTADATGLAALWVGSDNNAGMTSAMGPYVVWSRH